MTRSTDGPDRQKGLGVVVPYDFALDRELWRWTPPDVSLHLTRLPLGPTDVTLRMVTMIGDPELVGGAVRDLLTVGPLAVAYACTSGSFVRGPDGERALVAGMTAAGAPAAVTTSGALLQAVRMLGLQRISIATPYSAEITDGLGAFLSAAGVAVVGTGQLGLTRRIWTVPYRVTAELIRRADVPAAQAVFVACTNLAGYHLIADLEAELGKPVLTANQLTMWAALRLVGSAAVGAGQSLLTAGPVGAGQELG